MVRANSFGVKNQKVKRGRSPKVEISPDFRYVDALCRWHQDRKITSRSVATQFTRIWSWMEVSLLPQLGPRRVMDNDTQHPVRSFADCNHLLVSTHKPGVAWSVRYGKEDSDNLRGRRNGISSWVDESVCSPHLRFHRSKCWSFLDSLAPVADELDRWWWWEHRWVPLWHHENTSSLHVRGPH